MMLMQMNEIAVTYDISVQLAMDLHESSSLFFKS